MMYTLLSPRTQQSFASLSELGHHLEGELTDQLQKERPKDTSVIKLTLACTDNQTIRLAISPESHLSAYASQRFTTDNTSDNPEQQTKYLLHQLDARVFADMTIGCLDLTAPNAVHWNAASLPLGFDVVCFTKATDPKTGLHPECSLFIDGSKTNTPVFHYQLVYAVEECVEDILVEQEIELKDMSQKDQIHLLQLLAETFDTYFR